MKRYECPSCHTRYHVEPAECPACMWVNDGETFMIDHAPEEDGILTQFPSITKVQAIKAGFAGYNNCPHLCVDVPDGFFTISARLSNGRRITFAFMPYDEGERPMAVDIIDHDSCETVTNGKRKIPVQKVILFDRGDKPQVPPIITCTTLCLHGPAPVK